MSGRAFLDATVRDLLVVGSGGPHGPLAPRLLRDLGRVRSVVDPDAAREALAEAPADLVIVVLAAGEDPRAAAAFLAEVPAGRAVWAPRAVLAEVLPVLAPLADELLPVELEAGELELRVRWAVARSHALRDERARTGAEARIRAACAALPPGADSVGLLTRGVDALAALPGVRGVRVEPAAPGEAPILAGAPAEGPADARGHVLTEGVVVEVPCGDDRLVVTALGATRAAVLTLRVAAHLPTDVALAAAREIGRALDAATLLEAELERSLRLERGCVARQRDLARVEAQLSRVAATRDALAGFLSHDLRSPITVLVGHCQMLAEGAVPAARRGASIETIRRQAELLGQTAAELLERHRAGPEEVGPTAVHDLATLAHDAVVRAQPIANLRRQALRLGGAQNAPMDVDAAGVGDMVDALVDCALRRAPEGGAVRVGVVSSAERVVLTVRGDGAAWPPSPLQADATPEGRGMAGIAARARARGGELTVAPVPGKAGELVLSLPRAATSVPWPLFVAAADDDAVDALVGLLASLRGGVGGHRFGPALPAALRRAGPNVVVLDAHRDADAALATLEAIRTDGATAGLPVIVVAPLGPVAARARHAGAFTVVEGPLDGARLLAAVLHARRVAAAARGALVARPLDPLTGLDTAATLALRLAPLQAAARAAGAPLSAVAVTGIAPRLDEPGRTRSVAEQLLVWVATELRARALPGELLARAEADALILVSPVRGPDAMGVIRDELRALLARARPRIGVTRVAVRGAVEVADLALLGEDGFKMLTGGIGTAAEVGHAS